MMRKMVKKLDSTSNPAQGDTGMKLFKDVSAKLKFIYKQRIFPLERHHRFHDLQNGPLEDGEFDNKPTVLLLGQYSTGKSTFIKFMIDADYPGLRVGPEPTTDKFVVVMHGDARGRDGVIIPGNAVTIDNVMGFRSLAKFGSSFLNRFQVSKVDAKLLECMTFIDTPGILSGSEARLERGYDLMGVLEWFAERVDRILLLFDVHQLDISDELLRCISSLRGYEDKVRLVLNKADGVDAQQLVRVYGALMWSLGRVTPQPESARVYIGSFWDEPFRNDGNRRLLEDEEEDLLKDLQSLPKDAAMRRINDLIKRTKRVKVHALIMDYMKNETPAVFGKDSKKKQLLANLNTIFEEIRKKHNIAARDFPDVDKMRRNLETIDFKTIRSLDPKLMKAADSAFEKELPKLLQYVYHSTTPKIVDEIKAFDNLPKPAKEAEEEEGPEDLPKTTPFAHGRAEGVDVGRYEKGVWTPWNEEMVQLFYHLQPNAGGKIGGLKGKKEMQRSKLPNSVLGRIWHLSDVDKDGQLDLYEFLLAKHLIQIKLDGFELPTKLPPHLKPPHDTEAAGATPVGTIMAPPRWGSGLSMNRSVSRCESVSGSVMGTGTLRKRNVKGLDPSTMTLSMSSTAAESAKPPRPPVAASSTTAAKTGAVAATTAAAAATLPPVAPANAPSRAVDNEDRISFSGSFAASNLKLADVNSYRGSEDSLVGADLCCVSSDGGRATESAVAPATVSAKASVSSAAVKEEKAEAVALTSEEESEEDADVTATVAKQEPTYSAAPDAATTASPTAATLANKLHFHPFASGEEITRKNNVVVVQPQTKVAPETSAATVVVPVASVTEERIEIKAMTEVRVTPELKSAPKIETAPEIEPAPAIIAAPEIIAAPKIKAAPEIEEEPEIEVAPEIEAVPDIQAEPEMKAAPAEPEMKASFEIEAEPEIKGAPEIKAEPEIQAEPEIKAAPLIKVIPETKVAPVAADIRFIDDEDWEEDEVTLRVVSGDGVVVVGSGVAAAATSADNVRVDETHRRHVEEIGETQKEMDKLDRELECRVTGGADQSQAKVEPNQLKIVESEEEDEDDDDEDDDDDDDDDDEEEDDDDEEEDDDEDDEDEEEEEEEDEALDIRKGKDLEVLVARASQEREVETSEREVQTERMGVKTTFIAKV